MSTLCLEQQAGDGDGCCIVYSANLDYLPILIASFEHPVNEVPVSVYVVNRRIFFFSFKLRVLECVRGYC
jgi:hypothetical protein